MSSTSTREQEPPTKVSGGRESCFGERACERRGRAVTDLARNLADRWSLDAQEYGRQLETPAVPEVPVVGPPNGHVGPSQGDDLDHAVGAR